MGWSSVLRTATAAGATMAVTLALCWGPAGIADGDVAAPEIKWPTLTVGDCTLTLRLTATSFKPGDKPVIEIHAVNSGAEAVEIEATCTLLSQPLSSRMSRVMVLPKPAWTEKRTLRIAPGKSVVSLPTETALKKGAMVSAQLKIDKQQIQTQSFGAGVAVFQIDRAGGAVPLSLPGLKVEK